MGAGAMVNVRTWDSQNAAWAASSRERRAGEHVVWAFASRRLDQVIGDWTPAPTVFVCGRTGGRRASVRQACAVRRAVSRAGGVLRSGRVDGGVCIAGGASCAVARSRAKGSEAVRMQRLEAGQTSGVRRHSLQAAQAQGDYFGPSQQSVGHVVARAALIAERSSGTSTLPFLKFDAVDHAARRPPRPSSACAGATTPHATRRCARDSAPPPSPSRDALRGACHGRALCCPRTAHRRRAGSCFPRPLPACAFHIGTALIPAPPPKADAPPAPPGQGPAARPRQHHDSTMVCMQYK